MSLVGFNHFSGPQCICNGLQLSAIVDHFIARATHMTVIGATHFHTIFFDDVSAAALDDLERRDDFQFMFVAFSKGHIRNYRLVETGLMVVVLSRCGLLNKVKT